MIRKHVLNRCHRIKLCSIHTFPPTKVLYQLFNTRLLDQILSLLTMTFEVSTIVMGLHICNRLPAQNTFPLPLMQAKKTKSAWNRVDSNKTRSMQYFILTSHLYLLLLKF